MFEQFNFTYIIGIQRFMELSTSALCLLMNLYFVTKFSRISSIHPNFRTVLISFHLLMATATLFHPILMLIPQRWYSIKDGKILNACLYYSWSYFQNSIVYLVDIKYLLIGLERNIAMRNRHTYEKRDGSDAKRLLIRAGILCMIGTALKDIFVFFHMRNLPWDERLQLTFSVDLWASSILMTVSLATASYFYGLYEFDRLSKFVKRNYYAGKTLTESFQIKQIGVVVNVLWPIMVAFATAIVFAFVFQTTWMYYHFWCGVPMSSDICQCYITAIYLVACIYNIYSTAYLILYFKPVRRALLADITGLFGLKLNLIKTEPAPIDASYEREKHFKQLQQCWEVGPYPQRL